LSAKTKPIEPPGEDRTPGGGRGAAHKVAPLPIFQSFSALTINAAALLEITAFAGEDD